MRVYVDASPLQDEISAERGIGRYVAGLAGAIERHRPDVVERWVLRPGGPVPPQVPDLVWRGKAVRADDPSLVSPDIWHITSPLEPLCEPLDVLWPRWARSPQTRLYVTLYDLIPMVFPETYLSDRKTRVQYQLRSELVARADRVLAISEATARDATRLLGIPPSRIDVVGTGTSETFLDGMRTTAEALPRPQLPGLRGEYVLYTGGIDFRKNIDSLLQAWARIDTALRRVHQLVIVCRASDTESAGLQTRAHDLGIGDSVLVSGYVPDPMLKALYAHTKLFVFPSLYEGFGLPVVEAAASGAPIMVGDNSSLRDLVQDARGRVRADDPADLAAGISRTLTDNELREKLRQPNLHLSHRWEDVAGRVVDSYAHTRVSHAGRTRVWLVSPMPPTPSGVADYSMQLLHELARVADVDVLTSPDATHEPIPGVHWYSYDQAEALEAYGGTPNLRLLAMGNSEFHVPVLRILRRFGGVAIAHDVRFTGLLAAVRDLAPALIDEETRRLLDAIAAERRPGDHERHLWLDPHRYYLLNGLLTDRALQGSNAIVTHSRSAATLARLNVATDLSSRVSVIPFGHRVRDARPDRDAVVSLGIQHWTKDSSTVCRAFVQLAPDYPDVTFAIIGAFFDQALLDQCKSMIDDAGLNDRVLLTGRVGDAEYDDWLARGRLAVQLRTYTNGESSAAVADCLGAGVPLVTTALGAAVDLEGVSELVPANASVDEVASCVRRVLNDDDELQRMSRAGLDYARGHSFRHVARALLGYARN